MKELHFSEKLSIRLIFKSLTPEGTGMAMVILFFQGDGGILPSVLDDNTFNKYKLELCDVKQ
jgi:hypothetical protein